MNEREENKPDGSHTRRTRLFGSLTRVVGRSWSNNWMIVWQNSLAVKRDEERSNALKFHISSTS